MFIRTISKALLIFIAVFAALFSGCLKEPEPNKASSEDMILDDDSLPAVFDDDLPPDSLLKAVDHSLSYLKRISPTAVFKYGRLKYSPREVAMSFKLFKSLLNRKLSPEEFSLELKKRFLIFQSPDNQKQEVLFTGYYEPIFEASLTPDEEFHVPLYSLPEDIRVLSLGRFRPSLKKRSIVYRLDNDEILPYYNRREIMEKKILGGRDIEIAWMKDPVDLFFLQIQGSGTLSLSSGAMIRVDYNGSNGRPYYSIGKLLVKENKMKLEEVSMQSLRQYLSDHPESRDDILYYNQSYTFFKLNNNRENPLGSIKVPLTPHRSIATDYKIFPKGALAFVKTQVPIFNESGEFQDYRNFSRMVLNQDTGGAIRGTDRVDLFWGKGELAEKSAGVMRTFGQLYFIVAKKEALAVFADGRLP